MTFNFDYYKFTKKFDTKSCVTKEHFSLKIFIENRSTINTALKLLTTAVSETSAKKKSPGPCSTFINILFILSRYDSGLRAMCLFGIHL